jgi:hypothetical protein
MAAIAQTPVAWPKSVELPSAFRESYPATLPPLRQDRDTILIGLLEGQSPVPIRVSAAVGQGEVQLQWTVTPAPPSDQYGYLPQLVDAARENGGLTLPTIGSVGLREVGRLTLAAADSLAEIGAQAMKTGDLAGARQMAESVLRRDPTNPRALAILRAIEKRTGSGDDSSLILGPDESGTSPPKPPR